ncbi:MAG: hypothetical protein ABI723_00165 [Bacteroidia bacterium]
MQTKYYQSVLSFLKSSTDLIIEQNHKGSVHSPFHAVHFPEKKITLHFIEIDKEKLFHLQPDLFSLMSDDAAKHHIKIIHLWEDVWLSHNEAVRLRLLSQLGISKKVHGRLTEVIKPDKKQADDFLDAYHLQQSTNCNSRLGLNYKDELLAVATFSKSRLMTYEKEVFHSYELIRFASKSGLSVVGGLSKMISAFMKEQNAEHLMTYADRDWSNGDSYRKLGFIKIENTPPQLFWIHPTRMQRYYEHRMPEDFMNEFNLQKKKTLEDFLITKGYFKIYNSGNTKFILDLRKKS